MLATFSRLFSRLSFSSFLRGRLTTASTSFAVVFGTLLTGLAHAQVSPPPTVNLRQVIGGFTLPVEMIFPPDRPDRMFVVQQRGRIRIVDGFMTASPTIRTTDFLTLTGLATGGEQGLLGLAFDRNFTNNRIYYVFYTRSSDGALVIAAGLASADGTTAVAVSTSPQSFLQTLLTIPHGSFSNHNGGKIAIDPDGFLVIATGDGGSGGDPERNALNRASRLGKLLRIQPTGTPPNMTYVIPAGNPYQPGNASGFASEILHYGLRNPWKFSFDRGSGDLYIGDVGQDTVEEVNFLARGAASGQSFGWGAYEGNNCFNNDYLGSGSNSCNTTSNPYTAPILTYQHDNNGGVSITGGYVYNGYRSLGLRGYYLYADYSSERIFWGKRGTTGAWSSGVLVAPGVTVGASQIAGISSFGEDSRGEMYFIDYGGGRIIAFDGTGTSLPRVKNDLSNDGREDLLISAADGRVDALLMGGQEVVGRSTTTPIFAAGSGWSVVLSGDLDGNGTADIVARHTDGRVAVLLMSGFTASSNTTVLGAGSGWTPSHLGDFNGDGRADIVWRHTDGRVALWLMNGAALQSGAELLAAGSAWSVSHVADLNGDGNADIVWRNTDGSVALWLMNGASLQSGAGVLGANTVWTVTHVADFNGDGRFDLLWRNTDGTVATWLLNGTTVLPGSASILGANAAWTASHVADLDGDGKTDIIWRNVDGSVAAWLMDGATLRSGGGILGAGSGWQITHTRDLNSDGKADLVWRNVNGSSALWLMNGLSLIAGANAAALTDRTVVPPAP
jgi:glucose/arabinose dehydrogenase